jgi:hypothetical protein
MQGIRFLKNVKVYRQRDLNKTQFTYFVCRMPYNITEFTESVVTTPAFCSEISSSIGSPVVNLFCGMSELLGSNCKQDTAASFYHLPNPSFINILKFHATQHAPLKKALLTKH